MGGHDLELALILADGGAKGGGADPAIEALSKPLFFWAQAVWHRWFPVKAMKTALWGGVRRMARAAHPWSVVRGPAAAMAATAKRLEWTVRTTNVMVTDQGRELLLDADPPVVILREAQDAARRWRLRNAQKSVWWLGDPSTHEVMLAPTLEVAFGKGQDSECQPAHRAALRSAVANRQWTQRRCWVAGWAQHDRCKLCLHRRLHGDGGEEEDGRPEGEADATAVPARPTLSQEQLDGMEEPLPVPGPHPVPMGTAMHRVCDCPFFAEERQRHGPAVSAKIAATPHHPTPGRTDPSVEVRGPPEGGGAMMWTARLKVWLRAVAMRRPPPLLLVLILLLK